MASKRRWLFLGLLLVLALASCGQVPASTQATPTHPSFRLLVFSRTTGFRHASIPAAIDAVRALVVEHGGAADFTEDPTRFTDATLAQYQAVVFLLTTGDVLNDAQQAAFERYIGAGGGFVGVHSASDTEYGWAWYGGLVGAYLDRVHGHSAVVRATVHIADRNH